MNTLARVTSVDHLGDRVLRISFSDGLIRELDLTPLLVGSLADLDVDDVFALACVDVVSGTVCWPNGVDLDPDVLHGDQVAANGIAPLVRREYRVRQVG